MTETNLCKIVGLFFTIWKPKNSSVISKFYYSLQLVNISIFCMPTESLSAHLVRGTVHIYVAFGTFGLSQNAGLG